MSWYTVHFIDVHNVHRSLYPSPNPSHLKSTRNVLEKISRKAKIVTSSYAKLSKKKHHEINGWCFYRVTGLNCSGDSMSEMRPGDAARSSACGRTPKMRKTRWQHRFFGSPDTSSWQRIMIYGYLWWKICENLFRMQSETIGPFGMVVSWATPGDMVKIQFLSVFPNA